MQRVVGVIPARLESARLGRKALRTIAGHPMIAWVYRRARESRSLDRLVVATDSEEIAARCGDYQIPVMMTSAAHRSGTERVAEVMGRERAEVYVNIQGDEPMISAAHVELLLAPFAEDAETAVTTLKVEIRPEEAPNPNNVKVVTDARGRALYFSRAMIPCHRASAGETPYYKHLGLYAYSRSTLEKLSALAPSRLELAERLEQLRFLENGIAVTVVETKDDTIGVDTEEDLTRVEGFFRRTGTKLPGESEARFL